MMVYVTEGTPKSAERMRIALATLGMMFAFLLHHRETGPHGHGLETITASSQA